MGGNAAGARGLPSALGLPQAGQDGGSPPESGQGHNRECGQGEVFKLFVFAGCKIGFRGWAGRRAGWKESCGGKQDLLVNGEGFPL